MSNVVRTILRRATRAPDEPLNILTFVTHERFEPMLAKTGHNFWSLSGDIIRTWNHKIAPPPSNYNIIPIVKGTSQIPSYLDFDLILSQNKFGQFQMAREIVRLFALPHIHIEHTLPGDTWDKFNMADIAKMRADHNVFLTEYGKNAWHGEPDDPVINNSTDVEVFKPTGAERQPIVLSIVNDWIKRDMFCGYTLWKEIVSKPQIHFPVKVLGDTPGLSQPAKSIEELVEAYSSCSVFLNTTLLSTFPTVLLEAMACECPVVSTATCGIDKCIVEHGVTGFVSNDPIELREYCKMLLSDKILAKKMGQAARRRVIEKFGMSIFLDKWQTAFQETLKRKHV